MLNTKTSIFKTFFLFLSLSCLIAPSFAKDLSAAKKTKIITKIARAIEQKYVFPDMAKKLSLELKANLEANKYDNIKTIDELITTLNANLYSLAKDKHLNLIKYVKNIQKSDPEKQANYYQLTFLPDDIALLKLDEMKSVDQYGNDIVKIMDKIKNSKSLIIDLRNNGGGQASYTQMMLSYFIKNKKNTTNPGTYYNSMRCRKNNQVVQWWTNSYVPGKKLPELPIYVLTSKNTFSAGEELSYDLQALNRAIIIGEVTKGGANPGASVEISDDLLIFIPQCESINPITKSNWEGKGVIPDISVSSKDALNKAISIIKGK